MTIVRYGTEKTPMEWSALDKKIAEDISRAAKVREELDNLSHAKTKIEGIIDHPTMKPVERTRRHQ